MEAALSEHREHERNLRNTLLTAQRLADELKENAEQEAKRIIREAEVRADLLVEKAQLRLDDIQRDIDGLRLKRREVETSLESTIQTLRGTLDYWYATGMDGTLKTRSCCIGPGRQATRRLAKRLRRGARSGGSSKTSDRLHLSDLVKHPIPAGSREEV